MNIINPRELANMKHVSVSIEIKKHLKSCASTLTLTNTAGDMIDYYCDDKKVLSTKVRPDLHIQVFLYRGTDTQSIVFSEDVGVTDMINKIVEHLKIAKECQCD